MMSVVAFCGPSLPAEVLTSVLPEASIREPAACGDVLRAARQGPSAIALVDGYFDHRRSVWHKEILWALHAGVRVYGAASMGALRAVEMTGCGMVGVGWVYRQFRDGLLEDDDEVAVLHEPKDRGYRLRSDAMVNLRRTLELGVREGVLRHAESVYLTSALKAEFYPRRSGQLLLDLARRHLDPPGSERFCAWLERGGVIDQKRADALELFELIRAQRDGGVFAERAAPPERPFTHTNAWQALLEETARLDDSPEGSAPAESGTTGPVRRRLAPPRQLSAADPGADPAVAGSSPDPQRDEALKELERTVAWMRAVSPARCDGLLFEAALRAWALSLARQEGAVVDPLSVQVESERFRMERGLYTPESTGRWLAAAGVDLQQFSALMHDNVLAAQLAPVVRCALLPELRQVLLMSGVTGPGAPSEGS